MALCPLLRTKQDLRAASAGPFQHPTRLRINKRKASVVYYFGWNIQTSDSPADKNQTHNERRASRQIQTPSNAMPCRMMNQARDR